MRSSASVLICTTALLAGATSLGAQTISDYNEFYGLLTISAIEQVVPCYPIIPAPATPSRSAPLSYGVLRDSLGRVTRITRFSFGNPDTKGGPWTTMRVAYTDYDTVNTVVQRRTFFNASGMPVTVGRAFAEEVITRKSTGQLLMRKLVDRAGKPVNDDAGVSRAMFRSDEPGTIIEEWYYNSGKLHYGAGSDGQFRPFAAMPIGAYYRRMKVDDRGRLLREEVWDFDKKPIPFPGGEMIRAYEVNDCGQPARATFLDLKGEPMADSDGIAAMTFDYDAAGRLVGWRSFDLAGDPKGRKGDNAAGARYSYRAFDGMLLGEELFDPKGNPVATPRQGMSGH
jgi:YD repeat-containing protein